MSCPVFSILFARGMWKCVSQLRDGSIVGHVGLSRTSLRRRVLLLKLKYCRVNYKKDGISVQYDVK